MNKRNAAIAFILYVAGIVLANVFISHVGTPIPGGTHLLPVGFGLMAASGVYWAGLTFPARDVMQRSLGRYRYPISMLAVIVGAAISYGTSVHAVALASGYTFLVSETTDLLVFSPFRAKYLAPAVAISSVVSSAVDTAMFLWLAGIPFSVFEATFIGKMWIGLAALPVIWGLRRKLPAIAVAA